MAVNRTPQIEEILRELELTTSQVEASAVVSVEGLPICSAMPLGVDDGILAAMTATILSVAERAAGELARGKLNRVLVEGGDGYFIISSAGRDAILAVLTKSKTNLGMVFLAMDRACEKISKLI